jgi:aspartyl protease family protein
VSHFARLAFVTALSAFSAAGAVTAFSPQPLRADRLGAAAPAALSVARTPSVSVRKGADGHFWADGEVNGEPVRFLVDTGSTDVALTPADAQRLGFDPRDLRYGQRVTTAAGSSRAALVTLSSVAVGGARLPEVKALVVESGLDTSLLGMSYLGRLSRFVATRESLVLEL